MPYQYTLAKTLVTVTCEVCGARFDVPPCRANKARFCGHNCRAQWQRATSAKAVTITFTCLNCEQPFPRTAAYVRKQEIRGRTVTFCSIACSAAYQAGRRDTSDRHRASHRQQEWRKAVLRRDKRTCQHCGSTRQLHVHHVKPWAQFPEARYDVSNGLTLCSECHNAVHRGPLAA